MTWTEPFCKCEPIFFISNSGRMLISLHAASPTPTWQSVEHPSCQYSPNPHWICLASIYTICIEYTSVIYRSIYLKKYAFQRAQKLLTAAIFESRKAGTHVFWTLCGQELDRRRGRPETVGWPSFHFWSSSGPKPDQNSGWPKLVTHCFRGVAFFLYSIYKIVCTCRFSKTNLCKYPRTTQIPAGYPNTCRLDRIPASTSTYLGIYLYSRVYSTCEYDPWVFLSWVRVPRF